MSTTASPLKYTSFDSRKVLFVKSSLYDIVYKNRPKSDKIVCLCIGSDRSTGDALGPLAGSQLNSLSSAKYTVKGTIENPVHAKNLSATLTELQTSIKNPFIIAVDACLGKSQNIGKIIVEEGPVKPGAGVNKQLDPVGDCHITGIVNVSGFMEYMVLQNTRLNRVISLANIITQGINFALREYCRQVDR